jgi:hypothetical protein
METRSVSRCIAVAAHGKRCQQSPFRGSPYCWHHTQSRKVWPPSRPGTSRSTARASMGARPETSGADLTVASGRALRASGQELARDLIGALDEDTLAVLVEFLRSDRPGAVYLARENGRIVIGDAGRPSAPRAATG